MLVEVFDPHGAVVMDIGIVRGSIVHRVAITNPKNERDLHDQEADNCDRNEERE